MAKNIAPRIAVARESAFACPRPVMKLPVPPPAQRPALGALQKDDGDQRNDDQDMNDDQNGLHEGLEPAERLPQGGRPRKMALLSRRKEGVHWVETAGSVSV